MGILLLPSCRFAEEKLEGNCICYIQLRQTDSNDALDADCRTDCLLILAEGTKPKVDIWIWMTFSSVMI
jgi:hypothetical protein